MMTKPHLLVALAVWSVLVGPGHSQPATAAEKCIGDWAEAATIVRKREMIDVAALSKIVREKFAGKIMTARLCKSDDGYFYRLVIRGDDGRVRRVKIDASKRSK